LHPEKEMAMATKLTDFFYELSPTETLTFRITGEVNPRGSFDGTSLGSSSSFSITPEMTEGLTAVHELALLFIFPPGVSGTSTVDVEDSGGQINSFTFTGPNNGNFTKVQISLEVV
jgi:hypothetical protein